VRQLARPVDPFVVGKQISTVSDPREVAARAAWWSLAAPKPNAPLRIATALGLPAGDRAGPPLDPNKLGPVYESAQAAQAKQPVGGTIAQRRFAVEPGQGQLWVLLASPCALLNEGPDETGTAALAALSATLSAPHFPGVTVEPWISPEGVGIIAHGSARRASESAAALAQRVARAVGSTFGNVDHNSSSFTRANRSIIQQLKPAARRYDERLAFAASPNHPAWLLPLGTLLGQLNVDHERVNHRWRTILHAPVRLAVIANVDEQQAQVTAGEVDRWLLPETRGAGCPQVVAVKPPQSGSHTVKSDPAARGRMLLGLIVPAQSEQHRWLAVVLTQALGARAGPLGRALARRVGDATCSTRLVGGPQKTALLIEVLFAPHQLELARKSVIQVLKQLQRTGLARADFDRAVTQTKKRVQEARTDPRVRLAELWAGRRSGPPQTPPTVAAMRKWLAQALDERRLIVVLPEKN